MDILQICGFFYLIYSAYTIFVILVSDYPIVNAVVGLLSIWLVYLAMLFGYRTKKRYYSKDIGLSGLVIGSYFPFANITNWKRKSYILVASFSWICSVLSAKYYTSRGLISVIRGLLSGTDAYSIYQQHAKDANIGALTFEKIPFVLMLTFCTFITIWSIAGVLLGTEKLRRTRLAYLLVVVASYLYFGIARGTNYEMYIVFVTTSFCVLKRGKIIRGNEREKKAKSKSAVLVFGLGIVVILLFRVVVGKRGYVFQNQICAEIAFSPDSFISRNFPLLTNIGLSFFRYLGWGTFTIGVMNWDSINSVRRVAAMLLPGGHMMLYNTSLSDMTRDTVSVGVGWVPDYMFFIDYLGLPLFLFAVFLVGRLIVGVEKSRKPDLLSHILGIFIFIEMLSIPVGNFIITSTPILLTLVYTIVWGLWCSYYKCNTVDKEIIIGGRNERF